MQSIKIQNQQIQILERQINQLFTELVSVWKESDKKKIESVKRLAARMEELYLQAGLDICNISTDIARRLEQEGIKTAYHVSDYLDDKYKQKEKQHFQSRPDNGAIDDNNLLEVLNDARKKFAAKNPYDERTKDEIQGFEEFAKKIKDLREVNRQVAKLRGIALDFDKDTLSGSTDKDYNSVHTEVPDRNYRGPVYQELALFVEDIGRYHYDMTETLEDIGRWYEADKIPEQQFIQSIRKMRGYFQDVRKIIAPAKDLKYGTSLHNWFHTLLKFLSHGKHAGAVMTSIQPHKYPNPNDKRPFTREQVGDRVPYVEDLLEDYAESKVFLNHVKAFFRRNREWDRDDRILKWRREFCEKLVRTFADDGDFYNWISNFREKEMDSHVASRRVEANDTLSRLA